MVIRPVVDVGRPPTKDQADDLKSQYRAKTTGENRGDPLIFTVGLADDIALIDRLALGDANLTEVSEARNRARAVIDVNDIAVADNFVNG